MKTDFLTVIVLFGIIIILTVWFSSTPEYIPYSESITQKYSRFEGFLGRNPLEYSTATNNAPIDSSVSDYLIAKSTSGPKAVGGFNGFGVFNTPDVATKEELDIYSKAEGSLNATGYGYYNSKGPLVFDENMKKMLMTRGMNTTGASSSLGGSAV